MISTYTKTNNINLLPPVEIRQIYIWALSTDNKYILVAKNNKKYHQPGGHPEKGESINQTIIREMHEETGLEITEEDLVNIKFIGFYNIDLDNENFLQLRFLLKLNKSSREYNLEPKERESELEDDRVKYVNFFTIEEAFELIPWLKDDAKDEVESVLNNL